MGHPSVSGQLRSLVSSAGDASFPTVCSVGPAAVARALAVARCPSSFAATAIGGCSSAATAGGRVPCANRLCFWCLDRPRCVILHSSGACLCEVLLDIIEPDPPSLMGDSPTKRRCALKVRHAARLARTERTIFAQQLPPARYLRSANSPHSEHRGTRVAPCGQKNPPARAQMAATNLSVS